MSASPPSSPIVTAYFQRREDLRRFFLARLGPGADVEDLIQELYIKVKNLDGEPIENPPAYLYRLASNLMLDRMRRQRRAGARDAEWRRNNHATLGALDVVDTPDAEAAVIARQRLQRLTEALKTLAPLTQKIFELHKFEGLTHAETAAKLGVSRSAVEKHVSLALKHLITKIGR